MLLTPPIQRRSLLPTLLAGLMLTMCLAAMGALWAPSAQAHSELVSITPPDGATLEAAPTEIVLTFSANVIGDFTQIEVQDGTG
ncbi:MAG TPA: copper resistance protein CopC, partial [Phycicoccus sp.]|nr:copper resistance protein CopC [Phycicoccus sp.]